MGSRDKETKSNLDKLKNYFKKGSTAPLPPRNEVCISSELEQELSPGRPGEDPVTVLTRRLRAMAELTERLHSTPLAPDGGARVWSAVRDLAEGGGGEARAAALGLLRAVAPHADVVMREVLFRLLQRALAAAPPPAHRSALYHLLHALTNGGRDITCFEEKVGGLLVQWAVVERGPELMALITNVVKFNAAHLDEHVVRGIVTAACAALPDGGLELLEAVVSYSLVPTGALPALVAALCRAVNVESQCRAAWRVMRHVVGADVGPAALWEMVRALHSPDCDPALVRGCVFFVTTALWGGRRVPTLAVSPLAVLPGLLAALHCDHPVVVYEVVVAVHTLVSHRHHDLYEPSWDLVLQILHRVIQHDKTVSPRNELVHGALHEVITAVEQLEDAGQYAGDPHHLLEVVDAAWPDRPESSTLRALPLLARRLSPLRPHWARDGHALADRYVRRDPRPVVRVAALHELHAAVHRHRALYADEMIERLALPVLTAAAADPDPSLRAAAARFASELAQLNAERAADLVDVLESVLERPVREDGPAEPVDVAAAVHGLVAVAAGRGAAASRAHLLLLEALEAQYRRGGCLRRAGGLRAAALEAVCGGAAGGRVWAVLGAVAARERDWAVLQSALRLTVRLVRSSGTCARRSPPLDVVAGALCALVADRSLGLPECLTGAGKVSQCEFHGAVLGTLAALAPHHGLLEPMTQQRVVRTVLKYGMVLRQPAPCIAALTVFTLEARDTMVRMLPEVLLDLSKISDTKMIACPMLEFLSTLTRLPAVFASFVEDQYMSVFAILLPYTNPSRYNHYVVSLAHHVIAAWFLKCRLQYRRNFVRFIVHGLHNYIIMPFEEQMFKGTVGNAGAGVPGVVAEGVPMGGTAGAISGGVAGVGNEDSSSRKRSSSLGSRAPVREGRGGGGVGGSGEGRGAAPFHVELTETCVELLARYSYSPCVVRGASDTASFLVRGGVQHTWLVGHKLVTISTPGCAQNPPHRPMCDTCRALLAAHRKEAYEGDSDGEPDREESECGSEGGEGVWGPCWAARWAEVRVRSAVGETSWTMRLQNSVSPGDEPLLGDEVAVWARRRPVRRSNSSPEMSASPPRAPPPPRAAIPEEGEVPRARRANTISVMSPLRRPQRPQPPRAVVAPAFLLLQLYHNVSTAPGSPPPLPGLAPADARDRPLRVSGAHHERTVKNLDLVPPLETYKVGVVYVGVGQAEDETAILRNCAGSARYSALVAGLGALVALDGAVPPHLYLHVERPGAGGHYTYVWHDDVMQVHFHVATAMPLLQNDPNANEKRKYIGNDYVSIVYNDSGEPFNIHTIKGQFNFCVVIVEPLEQGLNRVFVSTKDERIRTKYLSHLDTVVISDHNVALLARQMALHCSLAALISQSLKVGGAPYASNCLERLRIIKRLRHRLTQERPEPAPYAPTHHHTRVAMDDFTHYT